MPNGDILTQVEATIERGLALKRLSPSARVTLEVQRLMIAYLRQSHEDHEKVRELYQVYKAGRWFVVTILTVWTVALVPTVVRAWGQLLMSLNW